MINPLIYTTCKIYTYFMRPMQDIQSSDFAIIQWTQLYYSYFDWISLNSLKRIPSTFSGVIFHFSGRIRSMEWNNRRFAASRSWFICLSRHYHIFSGWSYRLTGFLLDCRKIMKFQILHYLSCTWVFLFFLLILPKKWKRLTSEIIYSNFWEILRAYFIRETEG